MDRPKSLSLVLFCSLGLVLFKNSMGEKSAYTTTYGTGLISAVAPKNPKMTSSDHQNGEKKFFQ